MTNHHAVAWIDHNEARALALDVEGTAYREIAHVRSSDTATHSKKYDGHRHPAHPRFLLRVEEIVASCEAVVLVGPSTAKDELLSHLEGTRSPQRARIVAVSSLDRVTDPELAARAREIFRSVDAMKGIHVGATRSPS